MTTLEMTHPLENTATKTPAKAARLYYVDHLRTFLMVLVVLHHVSLVYGASLEGYYYVEPPFGQPLAFLSLLVFALVNQAWFMGAFFMLAGYFTPGSFNRKGGGAFLKDRLVRLGIPLVLFVFVLSPVSFIGYYLMPAELTGITAPITWKTFWNAYPNFLGIGPLWFVAMLLVFSIGYAAWRLLSGNRNTETGKASAPGMIPITLFILVLAGASYLVRIYIPLGRAILQFPTLAYLPQYLSFFILGILASRRHWFQALPAGTGFAGFAVAITASVLLFPLAFSGQWFSLELSSALDNAFGAGHWQSAVYALWDSSVAVGLSLGLLVLFRGLINGRGVFGSFLARQSYTVYIIHIPIIVFLAYAMRGIEMGSLQKFGLVSLVVLPVCYLAAYLVRKLPLASRVL